MSGLAMPFGPSTPHEPRGAAGRGRLWPVVALALGMHAALLAGWGPTLIGGPSMATPVAMSVRMVSSTESPKRAQVTSDASAMPQAFPPPEPAPATSPPPVAAPVTAPLPVKAPAPAGESTPDAARSIAANASTRAANRSPLTPPAESASTAVAPPPSALIAPAPPTTVTMTSAPPPAQASPPNLPAAPAYLSGGKLDPGPQPLHDIEPVYPEQAHLREGSVVLRLLINESGGVDNVAVVRSYPPGLFDASALAAFGAAEFSPGKVLGIPVKSQITIEVEFTPTNRGAAVSGRSY